MPDLPPETVATLREVARLLAASRTAFRSRQIRRARELVERLIEPQKGHLMRTAENLAANLDMLRATVATLREDAEVCAHNAAPDAPIRATAAALQDIHRRLASLQKGPK